MVPCQSGSGVVPCRSGSGVVPCQSGSGVVPCQSGSGVVPCQSAKVYVWADRVQVAGLNRLLFLDLRKISGHIIIVMIITVLSANTKKIAM